VTSSFRSIEAGNNLTNKHSATVFIEGLIVYTGEQGLPQLQEQLVMYCNLMALFRSLLVNSKLSNSLLRHALYQIHLRQAFKFSIKAKQIHIWKKFKQPWSGALAFTSFRSGHAGHQ